MNLTDEQKKKLYSILHNTQSVSIEEKLQKTNSCILLVDGVNLFLRAWHSNPAMDENGNHTGGIIGSLKSLGYTIKLLNPTRCIVIFDGVGGSLKRRQLYPKYKNNRKNKIRLNRTYGELSDLTDEEKQMKIQYIKFIKYLQTFPVNLLSLDYVEADDVIAYLAIQYFEKSNKIYIMSTDKDFFQLCSKNINVYSPTKKRIYGPAEVLLDYSIHPKNFVLFRAIDGDSSDNIDGIKGAGLKTIVKLFPWLKDEKEYSINDLIKSSDILKNKYKVCESIFSNKALLEKNIELMQLKNTFLNTSAQLHCNKCLETNKIPKLDRGAFFKLVREDLIDNNFSDHVKWVDEVFSRLDSVLREK